MGYHTTETMIPDGQIDHFAKNSGLNRKHAMMVMEENLHVGDNVAVYVKNSETERHPIENGKMTFHFFDG